MRPAPKKVAHRSLDFRRRAFNVREDAFGSIWESENRPRPGINFGHGVLQDLMFKRRGVPGPFDDIKCRAVIRNRDAAIVATVVQWLGTNVGWCFLEQAIERCGKRLVDIDPDEGRGWVSTADRLPTESGGYLVRQSFGGRVAGYSCQADFLVGTVPGKTGIWTSRLSAARSEVAWWFEPRNLKERP